MKFLEVSIFQPFLIKNDVRQLLLNIDHLDLVVVNFINNVYYILKFSV